MNLSASCCVVTVGGLVGKCASLSAFTMASVIRVYSVNSLYTFGCVVVMSSRTERTPSRQQRFIFSTMIRRHNSNFDRERSNSSYLDVSNFFSEMYAFENDPSVISNPSLDQIDVYLNLIVVMTGCVAVAIGLGKIGFVGGKLVSNDEVRLNGLNDPSWNKVVKEGSSVSSSDKIPSIC